MEIAGLTKIMQKNEPYRINLYLYLTFTS
jgi:hypothetical protein